MNKRERESERERSVIFFFSNTKHESVIWRPCSGHTVVCVRSGRRRVEFVASEEKNKNKGPEICTEGGGGTGLRVTRVSSI